MVEMESSYLTVDFFRKLPQELDKGGNPSSTANDRYTEGHLKRIGKKCLLRWSKFRLNGSWLLQRVEVGVEVPICGVHDRIEPLGQTMNSLWLCRFSSFLAYFEFLKKLIVNVLLQHRWWWDQWRRILQNYEENKPLLVFD